MTHYILDGITPKAVDLTTWATSKDHHRVILQTERDGVLVSTVFLGLNHNFADTGAPILFETMVFGGKYDEEMERYSTYQEALEGHVRWCLKIFNKESNTNNPVPDRIALNYFRRFYEVLNECYELSNNISIRNHRELTNKLELLVHLWESNFPECEKYLEIDFQHLSNAMSRLTHYLAPLNLSTFYGVILMCKGCADSIAKELKIDN